MLQGNSDAEAFLKPVSKVDVPDYYNCTSRCTSLRTYLFTSEFRYHLPYGPSNHAEEGQAEGV